MDSRKVATIPGTYWMKPTPSVGALSQLAVRDLTMAWWLLPSVCRVAAASCLQQNDPDKRCYERSSTVLLIRSSSPARHRFGATVCDKLTTHLREYRHH